MSKTHYCKGTILPHFEAMVSLGGDSKKKRVDGHCIEQVHLVS
jgi:hypothetical protein